MNDKKKEYILTDLLCSFSKKELNRLLKFVKSDFFNTDQYLIELYKEIRQLILSDYRLTPSRQLKIYRKVFDTNFKSEELNSTQSKLFHTKMSALLNLTKQFLVVEANNINSPSYHSLLYKELQKKEQWEILKRQLKRDRQNKVRTQSKDEYFYDLAYQIENGYFEYYYNNLNLFKREDNLRDCLLKLCMQFLVRVLKLQSAAITKSKLTNKLIFDFSYFEILAPLLNKEPYCSEPLIILFKIGIDLMKNKKESSYQKLLQLLEEFDDIIPHEYKVHFYTIGINYCIAKVIEGRLEYYQVMHNQYKDMDQKKLLTVKGFMDIDRLRNLVGLSCRVKDFVWAEFLTEKYRNLIKYEDKKSVHHFNLGVIHFYKNEYDLAIKHFIRVDKVNQGYDINGKMLLLKSHFDLDGEYKERSETIFRSAAHFIKNNKILTSRQKRGFLNFTNIFINLYRLKHRIGKINADRIEAKIEKMELNSDREWLLNRLTQIKRQKRFI